MTATDEMQFHPLVALLPMMEGEELGELTEDIRRHGLLEDIYTFEGQILDGRNRYLACLRAGIAPRYREWNGQGSLTAFVLSQNLHRRQLTPGQRAVIGEESLKFFEAEAKARQSTSTGGAEPQLKENIPDADKGQARDKAAKAAGTNAHYISDVKAIRHKAPELLSLMKKAKLSVAQARAAATLPAEDRQAIVKEMEVGAHNPPATKKRDKPKISLPEAKPRIKDLAHRERVLKNGRRRTLPEKEAIIKSPVKGRMVILSLAEAVQLIAQYDGFDCGYLWKLTAQWLHEETLRRALPKAIQCLSEFQRVRGAKFFDLA